MNTIVKIYIIFLQHFIVTVIKNSYVIHKIPCSIERIPCLGDKMGNGSPSFQKM